MSSLEPQRDPITNITRVQDKCELVMQFNAQDSKSTQQSTGRTGRSQQNKRKTVKGLALSNKRNGQQEEGALSEFSSLAEREPRPHSAMPTTRRPKTAQRVRINSTSEQIQDPNWLIQMADQLEQPTKTRQKRTSHLRTLHMKLKSSLIGSQSSETSAASGPLFPSNPAVPVQSGLPSSPAKIPVSILKQPSQSAASSTFGSSQATKPTATKQRKSRTGTANGSKKNGSSEKAARAKQQSVNVKGEQKPILATSDTTSSIPKLAPICADGQVKVSGWKRNNLLAKTLSHLDEIRGNQRPIFVPTKIQLPPSSSQGAASHSVEATTTEQEQLGTNVNLKSSTKFADVVKAALLASRRQANEEQVTTNTTNKRRSAGSSSSTSTSDQQVMEQQDHVGSASRIINFNHSSSPERHADMAQAQVLLQAQTSQAHRSNSTCISTPTVSITKQPAVQTASWNRNQTNPNRSSFLLETSARQFKLAHKNQQVLQHLRRRSNEIQAAQAAAVSENQTQRSSSGHLKDWKRLASQLALLGGVGGATKTVSNWTSLPANCQRFLNIENNPLRLTVSNEESSGEILSGKRGTPLRCLDIRQQHYQKRNSLLSVPSSNSVRKFSSSSMVVGPSGRLIICDLDSSAKRDSSSPNSGMRRSSDSEAYRLQTSQQQWNCSDNLLKEKNSPLVVHKTDLLQLLQVTSTGSPVGSARRSLQLNESGGHESPRRHRSSSTQSIQLIFMHNQQTPSHTTDETSITPFHSSREIGLQISTGDSLVSSEAFERKEENGRENEKERGEEKKLELNEKVAVSSKQEPEKSKRRDLSWVVKKTSRVAFFQEKLRRIRWRKSRAVDQEPQEATGMPTTSSLKQSQEKVQMKDDEVREDEADRDVDGEDEKDEDGQVLPELLGMDPTLIGDAIEIFLRSAMQSNTHDSEQLNKPKDELEGPHNNNNIQKDEFKLSSSSSTLSKEMVAGESSQ